MERKIGEIFEYNGEWYQCVECDSCGKCLLRTTECGSGTKSDLADEVFGECSKIRRSDSKHAIFKKLEKVGEPYDFQKRTFQTYKLHTIPFLSEDVELVAIPSKDNNTIEIEIKQNKEDMEEKKGYESKLKTFNLELAKQGKPVCTRDGRKARIICFDAKGVKPIIALIEYEIDERPCNYFANGRFYSNPNENNDADLMMLPEKKEGWVNVYYDNDASSHRGCRFIYDTKERAVKEAGSNYITTVKINWEE